MLYFDLFYCMNLKILTANTRVSQARLKYLVADSLKVISDLIFRTLEIERHI